MSAAGSNRSRTALASALFVGGALSLCRCSLLVDLDRLDDGPVGASPASSPDGGSADALADRASADVPAPDAGDTSAADGASDAGMTTAPVDSAAPADAMDTGGAANADSSTTSGDGGVADTGAPGEAGATLDAGSGDACALVEHSNGVGGSWEDCAPLDTFTQGEAMSACAAFGGSCVVEATCNVLDVYTFSGPPNNQTTYSWVYGTAGPVSLHPGDVLVFPRGQAPCSSLPSPSAKWR